jgi:hypothetical protein
MSETLKKIAEQGGDGKVALDYLREQERLARLKKIERIKLGGLIMTAIGLAEMVMIYGMHLGSHGTALSGLIPLMIGVAMLVYVYFLAGKES